MARKSFLSRVDSGRAISTGSKKNPEADKFIRQLNLACGKVLELLVRRFPGMHDYKAKKSGHSKKRKHKGIAGRFM